MAFVRDDVGVGKGPLFKLRENYGAAWDLTYANLPALPVWTHVLMVYYFPLNGRRHYGTGFTQDAPGRQRQYVGQYKIVKKA